MSGSRATPDNFELFYAYASGENPGRAQVMAAFIDAKKPFTPEHAHRPAPALPVRRARRRSRWTSLGGNMDALIDDILGQLESSAAIPPTTRTLCPPPPGELGDRAQPRRFAQAGGWPDRRHPRHGTARQEPGRRIAGVLRNRSANCATKLADVRKESMTDPLTGIANRKAFDEAMRAAIAGVSQNGEAVTLLLCDIDHFKNFNDTWGHQTGDQVLRLVASCLSENVKGRDTAARYGGEEFAVLLRGTGLEAATMVANQIRTTVETKKLVKKSTGDILGAITISIGVAQFAPGEAGGSRRSAAPMPAFMAPSTVAAIWWSTRMTRAWRRWKPAPPDIFSFSGYALAAGFRAGRVPMRHDIRTRFDRVTHTGRKVAVVTLDHPTPRSMRFRRRRSRA